MKQMFDISEKLIVGQSDGIYGVNPIKWEDSSWKQLSLVSDEEVISLSHAKVYLFSDSVSCIGKVNQNPASNTVREDKLTWFKSLSQYEIFWTQLIEWNISKALKTNVFALQKHKDVFLPAHPQKLYPLENESGPILNHKIIRPSILQCRSN